MLGTTRGRGAMRVGTIGVGTLDEAARRCGGVSVGAADVVDGASADGTTGAGRGTASLAWSA